MVVWNKLRESETKLLAAGSTKVIRDGRFSVEGTSIRITDVQPRDSGVYVCEINTDVPLNITVVLDVLGNQFPSNISIFIVQNKNCCI